MEIESYVALGQGAERAAKTGRSARKMGGDLFRCGVDDDEVNVDSKFPNGHENKITIDLMFINGGEDKANSDGKFSADYEDQVSSDGKFSNGNEDKVMNDLMFCGDAVDKVNCDGRSCDGGESGINGGARKVVVRPGGSGNHARSVDGGGASSLGDDGLSAEQRFQQAREGHDQEEVGAWYQERGLHLRNRADLGGRANSGRRCAGVVSAAAKRRGD